LIKDIDKNGPLIYRGPTDKDRKARTSTNNAPSIRETAVHKDVSSTNANDASSIEAIEETSRDEATKTAANVSKTITETANITSKDADQLDDVTTSMLNDLADIEGRK